MCLPTRLSMLCQDSSLEFPAPLANALSMWPADQLALRRAHIYFLPEDAMERAAHAYGILQMRAALKTHAEHCWLPLEDTQVFCASLTSTSTHPAC